MSDDISPVIASYPGLYPDGYTNPDLEPDLNFNPDSDLIKNDIKPNIRTEENPSPFNAANKIAQNLCHIWRYDLQQHIWRTWNDTYWQTVDDELFEQIILYQLEVIYGDKIGTPTLLKNTIKYLQLNLLERKWTGYDRSKWIPFNNGVYEVETKKLHDHAREFGFKSCLEKSFNEEIAKNLNSNLDILELLQLHAPTFYNWAMFSQENNTLKVLKLLAIINGVVRCRFYELQKFVYLLGVPGAGKGTFARLLENVVGKSNHTSTRISKLNQDFSLANIIDKQLVICPDERNCNNKRDWGGLLSLTGGDSISYRQIRQAESSAKFYGTLVVISNSPIFTGDTEGIDRRYCLVTFNNTIANKDSQVEEQIQSEIPALIAIALSMGNCEVDDLISGKNQGFIADFLSQQWLQKIQNDNVALFIEQHIVPAHEDEFMILGNKKNNNLTIYGAYLEFASLNNIKTKLPVNEFKQRLLQLFRELNFTVREARQRDNNYRIYGIQLRDFDSTTQCISELLAS